MIQSKVMFNVLYIRLFFKLFNISTLFADNTAETRYDLITGGTDSFTIDFFYLINFRLRASTLECGEQAFCSKINHIPKSIGLRSGEDGGQSFFDQKDLKLWEEIDGKTVRATCDQVIPHLYRVFRQNGWTY